MPDGTLPSVKVPVASTVAVFVIVPLVRVTVAPFPLAAVLMLPVTDGAVVVNDSGACSREGYASDITRTLPVSGRFTSRQKEIYEIALKWLYDSINAVKAGTTVKVTLKRQGQEIALSVKPRPGV